MPISIEKTLRETDQLVKEAIEVIDKQIIKINNIDDRNEAIRRLRYNVKKQASTPAVSTRVWDRVAVERISKII